MPFHMKIGIKGILAMFLKFGRFNFKIFSLIIVTITFVSCASTPNRHMANRHILCDNAFVGDLEQVYNQKNCRQGIPVIADQTVNDAALIQARKLIDAMLISAPEHMKDLEASLLKIVVIGKSQGIEDIPEYQFLRHDKNTDWNMRARGLGATKKVPIMSAGEENLLCLSNDKYAGEDIFVHEFAHTIVNFMGQKKRRLITADIEKSYARARSIGLFKATYAATNSKEYFAEGVQSFFNVNKETSPPDGIHNAINTREELARYDPTLYAIIYSLFKTQREIPSCHNKQFLRQKQINFTLPNAALPNT